jgi:diguanylate cyclase (GGDEF)-like protein
VNDADKKADMQRELLFQKRIAELGFQRHQLPWNMGAAPAFNLPYEETAFASEVEMETDALNQEDAERRVLTDLVSNAFNFRTFYKRLHYEVRRANRYQRPLSILLVGIDRLNLIGDQFGQEARDSMVRSTARVVISAIRDVDIPGRCREDVFGVILPETPVDGAEVAAERIRTKLEQFTIVHNWTSVSMTASVGAASFPTSAQKLDELFAKAAEALFQCNEHGGNAVKFAT